MPTRIVCYSSRGLAQVRAQLRGALRTISKFPIHPKPKRRRKTTRKTAVKKKTSAKKRPRKVKAKKAKVTKK